MNLLDRAHCRQIAASALLVLSATWLPACSSRSNDSTHALQSAVLSFSEFQRIESSSEALVARDSSPDCGSACQARRQEFRYVVYVGKQIYAYWDLKQAENPATDYNKLAGELEQSITTQTSLTEYYVTLRRWAAAFHDGHVNAMYKADDSDLEVYTAPLRIEVLAPETDHEKVIVSQVVPAEDFSSELDVEAGDEIIAINGKPVSAALDEVEKIVSGSTKRMRRVDGARRLVDVFGSRQGSVPLQLTVRPYDSNHTHEVTLYRTAEVPAKPSSGHAPGETGADNLHVMVLPGGIGYLRLDAFEGTQDEYLLGQAMDRLAGTQGLLIDVRRNGGGDQSGNVLLSRLSSAAITRYRTSPRMSDFMLAQRPEYFGLSWAPGEPFASWRNELVRAGKPEELYTGKRVMLLTGTECFSACDTFTAALKANHLATIAGEPTGGGTGTPLVFKLPVTGLSFRYSIVRGHTADDKVIEGVGTTPDFLIERTQLERSRSRDEQLLTALIELAKQIQQSAAPAQPAPAPVGPPPAELKGEPFESAIFASIRKSGPIWNQDANLSPTRASDRKLQHLAPVDEQDVNSRSRN